MRLRTQRQDVVVWSQSAHLDSGPSGFIRVRRAGPIRRFIRIGVLFAAVGLMGLARAVRPRWRPLLAGTVLTVAGVLLRHSLVSMVFVPGLLLLLTAPLIEAPDADRTRRCELARELAAYSTLAQRCDFEATLDRYPDAITRELREILAGQPPTAGTGEMLRAGRY